MGAVTVTPGETLGTLVYTFGVGSNKTMIVPNKSLSLSLSKQHRSSQVACIHIHGISMHYASLIMIYDIYTCIHIRTFIHHIFIYSFSFIHIFIYSYIHTFTHTHTHTHTYAHTESFPLIFLPHPCAFMQRQLLVATGSSILKP